jgi:hypothetical protein
VGRLLINIGLIIILILLTLFGLGPAFFADGTDAERTYTLLVLTFLYLLIFAIMYYVNKRIRKK